MIAGFTPEDLLFSIINEYFGGDDRDEVEKAVVKAMNGELMDDILWAKLYAAIEDNKDEIGVDDAGMFLLMLGIVPRAMEEEWEQGLGSEGSEGGGGGEGKAEKGGRGSGYHRPHFGRPGERGGSLPRGIGQYFMGEGKLEISYNSVVVDRLSNPIAKDRGYRSAVNDMVKMMNEIVAKELKKLGGGAPSGMIGGIQRINRYVNAIFYAIMKNDFKGADDRLRHNQSSVNAYRRYHEWYVENSPRFARSNLDTRIAKFIDDVFDGFMKSAVASSNTISVEGGSVNVVVGIAPAFERTLMMGKVIRDMWYDLLRGESFRARDRAVWLAVNFPKFEIVADDKDVLNRYFQSDEFKNVVDKLKPSEPVNIVLMNCANTMGNSVGMVDTQNRLIFYGFDRAGLSRIIGSGVDEDTVRMVSNHAMSYLLGLQRVSDKQDSDIWRMGVLGGLIPKSKEGAWEVLPQLKLGLAEVIRCAVNDRFGDNRLVSNVPMVGGKVVRGIYREGKGWDLNKLGRVLKELGLKSEDIINPEMKGVKLVKSFRFVLRV
jgi:hypothetical protein